ncbi:hypothetical protein GCM10022240_13510 [Microbacterium kribbense]|uniref:Uncharacterized protein n=1 Tax=Microbacterium kribbense TaxID=433645 RepID=A0ABP7GEF2_9MICO
MKPAVTTQKPNGWATTDDVLFPHRSWIAGWQSRREPVRNAFKILQFEWRLQAGPTGLLAGRVNLPVNPCHETFDTNPRRDKPSRLGKTQAGHAIGHRVNHFSSNVKLPLDSVPHRCSKLSRELRFKQRRIPRDLEKHSR